MFINPCIKAWSFVLDKIRRDGLLWYWPVLVRYNISLNNTHNFGSTRLETSRPPEPAHVLVWGDEEGAEESDCRDRSTHRIQSLRKGAWCCGRVHKVFQNQNKEILSNQSQNMLQFLTQWSRFDNLKKTCSMSKPSPIYFENQGNFLRKGKVLAPFKSHLSDPPFQRLATGQTTSPLGCLQSGTSGLSRWDNIFGSNLHIFSVHCPSY